LRSLPNLVHLGGELRDFADTAAVISLLDVVISVDTAVAHLAGALGKPVLILLPFAADFRWMRLSEDTPWYPTAKLIRQPAFGDWDGVIARLVDEIRNVTGWGA
jgi:ADP-heptose:LPS heptosyltransferase